MKQTKNDQNLLDLIVKLQEQVVSLDKKLDLIMGRVMATPALMPNASKLLEHNRPSHPSQERAAYKIICAECGKESSLPFKPSGDRPVYCKECFAARKKGTNLSTVRAEGGGSAANIAPTLSPVRTEIKAAQEATPKKKPAKSAKKTVKKKIAVKKKK